MNTCGRGPVPGSEKMAMSHLELMYQKNNLENFEGGPVQYSKKISYSNFLGRTSQKSHPVPFDTQVTFSPSAPTDRPTTRLLELLRAANKVEQLNQSRTR